MIAEAKKEAFKVMSQGKREGKVRCSVVRIKYCKEKPEVYCDNMVHPIGYIGDSTELAWFEAEGGTEYHIEFWKENLVVIAVHYTYPPKQKYFIELYYEVPEGKSLEEAVITAIKVVKASE